MSLSGKLRAGMRYWLCRISIAVLCSQAAAGENATINLNVAIARTLERNPNLMAFRYQFEAQQGRLTQSQLRPNLELGILVENVLGSGDFNGSNDAQTTLSLGWMLERGKRDHRVAVATAGVSLVESEAQIMQLDAIAETARLFLNSLANQERLIRTRAAVRLAEQTVSAISERVRAGRTPDADLARAEARFARVLLTQEDVEHELETSNHRLAAQWGESQPDFASVRGDISQLPTLDSFTDVISRVEKNPDFSRYVSERRLREAELRLAESEANPSWWFNTGIRRLEGSSDQALVVGVTIPLAKRNRNQGRLTEARAILAMTGAEQTAARVQIETQLFALYQKLQHSLHRASVLREKVLPRVEQALSDTQTAYASGRYGYFELQIVQAEVLDAHTALIETSIDAHKQLIEIERLTGTSMSSSVAGQ